MEIEEIVIILRIIGYGGLLVFAAIHFYTVSRLFKSQKSNSQREELIVDMLSAAPINSRDKLAGFVRRYNQIKLEEGFKNVK